MSVGREVEPTMAGIEILKDPLCCIITKSRAVAKSVSALLNTNSLRAGIMLIHLRIPDVCARAWHTVGT